MEGLPRSLMSVSQVINITSLDCGDRFMSVSTYPSTVHRLKLCAIYQMKLYLIKVVLKKSQKLVFNRRHG